MAEKIEHYRGDPTLKKAGSRVEWTPELIEEFNKCKNDIIYFSEKYIKIVTGEGLVPITLRDYQKELILSMQNNRATYALQCRQSGKTEAMRCFALHYIIFNEQKTVALLANRGATANEILGKIQTAYRHLPWWLQQGVSEWNKGSMVLENGSRILAEATSSSNIRGYTIQCLMLDEFAFIEDFDDFYASVIPTITAGKDSKIICCTTPNGLNHAYKFWNDAQEGKNDFNTIFVPWYIVPGRDVAWKEEILRLNGGDLQKFAQEFECEFLGSSATLIEGSTLKRLVENQKEPIAQDINMRQYEEPEENHRYVIVADTSEGKGLDYSAAHVIDITKMPYKQVYTFRSNQQTPADYARYLFNMSKLYNDSMVMLEINGVGGIVAEILFNEYEFENMIYTEHGGREGRRITSGFGKNVDRGLRMTPKVKQIGCSLLKLLIEKDELEIIDQNTVYEFSRFSKKNDTYKAEQGATDDLVMPLVAFAWLTDQQYFKELTDINTVLNLRELTNEELEMQMLPFGFLNDGMDDHREVIDLTSNPHDADYLDMFF